MCSHVCSTACVAVCAHACVWVCTCGGGVRVGHACLCPCVECVRRVRVGDTVTVSPFPGSSESPESSVGTGRDLGALHVSVNQETRPRAGRCCGARGLPHWSVSALCLPRTSQNTGAGSTGAVSTPGSGVLPRPSPCRAGSPAVGSAPSEDTLSLRWHLLDGGDDSAQPERLSLDVTGSSTGSGNPGWTPLPHAAWKPCSSPVSPGWSRTRCCPDSHLPSPDHIQCLHV